MSDLYIDNKGRLYIDGHQIERVTDCDVTYNLGSPEVSLVFKPRSVIYGDLPDYVTDEVLEAHLPVNDGRVSMDRAMDRARQPNVRQQMGKIKEVLGEAPVRQATPAKKTPMPKNIDAEAEYVESAPMDVDAQSTCDTRVNSSGHYTSSGGYRCTRPYGHTGDHNAASLKRA